MRILLVSWYFPPFNAIGAVRVGKFARFLGERGHDVRVICGSPPNIPQTLATEIPEAQVIRTRWVDVKAPPRVMLAWMRRFSFFSNKRSLPIEELNAVQGLAEPKIRRSFVGGWLHRASNFYVQLLATPDAMVGWIPFAVLAGKRLCRQWRPDLVFASGPPFSTFIVADHLARGLGVPWIGEFRDRWVDDPYFNDWPVWRSRLLAAIERRVVGNAAGLVTVSDPWNRFYADKFGKPVVTAYNGYDPRDFVDGDPGPPLSDKLTIVYTGVVYAGKRDPSPLFDALARLGSRRDRVRVMFVGTNEDHVRPLASQFGLDGVVEVLPAVPYKDSLLLQKRTDLLLLLQWNAPQEQGNCPAKLFEYIAAMRPIIGIGLETGVPAAIIRDRHIGIFTNDPAILAARIAVWLDQKEKVGYIPANPPESRAGLERDAQFAKLIPFLQDVLSGKPRPARNGD